MTQTIVKAGDYTQQATVAKIEKVDGHYHVKIQSQYKDSRFPEEWRTVYETTCEAWGLEALAQEIYEALREGK